MRIGTRSILFGAHCWFIHPAFVALAWKRLYGFPTDPRLWAAFVLHDLGYWGKPNLDGPEGERHVEWGAIVLSKLFDRPDLAQRGDLGLIIDVTPAGSAPWMKLYFSLGKWGQFSLLHSRFYAKRMGQPYSRLCAADKLACALEPWWLYLPRVWATGELREFMASAGGREGSKYNGEPEVGGLASVATLDADPSVSYYRKVRHWHKRMTTYMRGWAFEHRDGREDTWTPSVSTAPTAPAPAYPASTETAGDVRRC